MNLNLFLAKKIRGTGLSSSSNTIACISVAISICVILVSVAILHGFKSEIGKRATGFSGEILLTVPGMQYINDTYPLRADLSYLPEIAAMEEVLSISEVAYKPGMLKTETNVHGMLFKGVDSLYSLDFYADYLVEGRLPDFSGQRISDEVLISERLARMMGYRVGDRMTVYFVGTSFRFRRFDIVGLYNIQLEDLDERIALVDIRQVRRLNGWKDHASSCVEIALGGDGTAASVKRRNRVYEAIGRIVMEEDRDGDDSVIVNEIDSIYRNIFDWLALLDLNVLVVTVLMIAVAGFNMVSGLLILLFERISMIGILKSLGMRDREICKVFLLRGGTLVMKGMLFGNIVAALFLVLQSVFHLIPLSPENYFVNYVPVDISVWEFLFIDFCALAVMLLIMLLPSMFIAKVSPDRTVKMN